MSQRFVKFYPVDDQPRLVHIKKENELEQYQKLVGGYIQNVKLLKGEEAYVNEDGRRLKLKPNPHVKKNNAYCDSTPIYGNVVVLAGFDEEGETMFFGAGASL